MKDIRNLTLILQSKIIVINGTPQSYFLLE